MTAVNIVAGAEDFQVGISRSQANKTGKIEILGRGVFAVGDNDNVEVPIRDPIN